MIDAVSQTMNCDWDKVLELNIMQFLNIYCYAVDKANEESRKLKEGWKK